MLKPPDFEYISRLLKENSGLALTPDKAYLINTRLKPLLDRNNIADVPTMIQHMRAGRLTHLKDEVVDAMTTNESLFFRDKRPFEALTQMMLPQLLKVRPRGRRLRSWCAAAATGQEPFSIAILLDQNARQLAGRSVEILATDLSQAALKRARMGEYTAFEVGRGMPSDVLSKYFRKTEKNHYIISPEIRSRVTFQSRNLLDTFQSMGVFDIIFCRNVLIYFDRPTKANVLDRLSRVLAPDGYLVLGGPETTLGLSDAFARHHEWRNVYIRSDKKAPEGVAIERVCA